MKIKNRIVAYIAALMFASACTNSTAIALGTHDTDEQEPMTLYTTDWLRVREYPSFEANIVDVYAPGTAILATDVTAKYNGWIQMQYGSHKYYMHSDWLTMETPEEPTETIITSGEDSDEYDGSYPSYWMYSPEYFKENGVIEYNGYYFTYYSELVMPGEGLYIPGRWTDERGFVRDGNGNLCLASNTPDTMDRFSTVYTPWGLGVIYDYGTGNDAVIDVYVGW